METESRETRLEELKHAQRLLERDIEYHKVMAISYRKEQLEEILNQNLRLANLAKQLAEGQEENLAQCATALVELAAKVEAVERGYSAREFRISQRQPPDTYIPKGMGQKLSPPDS